jgi:hypothetical protein
VGTPATLLERSGSLRDRTRAKRAASSDRIRKRHEFVVEDLDEEHRLDPEVLVHDHIAEARDRRPTDLRIAAYRLGGLEHIIPFLCPGQGLPSARLLDTNAGMASLRCGHVSRVAPPSVE